MTAPVLEITNAARAFADRQALQDVSLSLAAGEILALLGPNGAGKTTLMRAVTGRLRLEAGTVRVGGLDPASDGQARRLLGIVPQTVALYQQLSARDNLDVFARLMGLSGKAVAEAVEQALQRAQLDDRADDLLAELSGGMQRRLNIVAGTLHNPRLLLLDEPTVGVDMNACESICALLQQLRAEGMAILLTTHDFDQAASMADRAAFMVGGKILREGKVEELVQSVFGDCREVRVSLAQPASAEAAGVLRRFGLRPDDGKRSWSGPLAGGYSELAEIETQLVGVGAPLPELRLRDPGLGGVFRQLTGEPGSS
jgi:ABC-2 type transport system ATP-binding protein